ncbi:Rne/Rng family ribonuclease [Ruficoccus amylovorans]|uniref:Rne/Rng family ribonuclease n=1 Tax=Ruficoccus amylovorans TaxID=1804625 RepID=A0A842HHX4_9BACT|nr:Rne/Rng family ribonuclease [Ruficoccus amylovorans]MBC2595770.1 Rne/Rng family ribonuclease [Ruficoccus amylovorans]
MKSSSPTEKNSLDHELRSPPKEEVIESIPRDQLKKESSARAKKRPILQKIVRVLSGQKERPYRELIINAEPLETRVALLVDGVLEKFEVERSGEKRMVGAVFAGKIQNLEPGLKAAFVDIGQPKNAFLHYWDILPAANDDKAIEIVRQNESAEQKKRRSQKPTLKDIPKLYPIGTNIVVQITKSQIGTKGPRTTTNLALPGRFLVLMPFSGQCGISRKIESKSERDRLKAILAKLTIPEGMGIIIRTAGEGKKLRYFVRDLHMLLKKWQKIEEGMKAGKPALLYQEPDIIERTVRDFLTEDIDRVLVDSEDRHSAILENISEVSPRSRKKIVHFKDDIPIFERFNIERQIEQTFQRTVPLPSGGEIVIDETEALVAIDVNTGSHKGKDKGGKDFIVNANLEAASEAARQIRLRNIGGLIILDFIDMKNKRDRKAVFDRMRKEMASDKAKSHVLPISQLGIMQMTRQRHAESHASGIYTGCPYCSGRGIVKSARTMSVEIQRKLVSVIRHQRNTTHKRGETIEITILLHPTNLDRLRHEDEEHLIDIEQAYNVSLSFKSDYSYHVENFRILDTATGQELR